MDVLNTNTRHDSGSPIHNFYSKKSILITGGTGFIGKVLIEKLLYSCPRLDKIYLLIRGANKKSANERLEEMIAQKPFDMRLKVDFVRQKLVAIESDISEPGLGLSPQDKATLEEKVAIIFHVAASVKFDAPLEVNTKHNVVATRQLLDLACKFKRLQCFVHVSTAYSNCQLGHIDERIYHMDVPEDLTQLVVTKEMLDKRPNTYTYTKAMAENVVGMYADRFNVVIVRPSIVMSSMREPAEGWVDTVNGPVGLSVLGALGILQKITVNSEVVFDLIPVDVVTNALISIGWAVVEKRHELVPACKRLAPVDLDNNNTRPPPITSSSGEINENDRSESNIPVFNLTTGSENPCSFYHYFKTGREEAHKKPSSRALRPLLDIPKQKGINPTLYWIHKIFSHLLFAYIIDILLRLFGHKRMVVKAVNKMHHANEMFDYFCSNQWNFVTDNVKRLRDIQSELDRNIFNCDVRGINWSNYARIGWLGCRRFILKEEDETFEYAKRRYRAICFMYYILKIFLVIALTGLAKSCISSPIACWMLLAPIYGVVYLL